MHLWNFPSLKPFEISDTAHTSLFPLPFAPAANKITHFIHKHILSTCYYLGAVT